MSNTKLLATTITMRLEISTSPIAEKESVSIFLSREYGTVDRRWHNRDPLTCRLASQNSPAEIALYFERIDFNPSRPSPFADFEFGPDFTADGLMISE
jgi:hypothetical protein